MAWAMVVLVVGVALGAVLGVVLMVWSLAQRFGSLPGQGSGETVESAAVLPAVVPLAVASVACLYRVEQSEFAPQQIRDLRSEVEGLKRGSDSRPAIPVHCRIR